LSPFFWLKVADVFEKKYLLFDILPALISFVIRVEDAELWNNIIFVAIIAFFLATLNYFYKTGNLFSVSTLILFVLVAPSFYLAGWQMRWHMAHLQLLHFG
jgi:hypothetical protein